MDTGFVEFRQLRKVGVFSYLVYFRFKSLVNGLDGVRPLVAVWSVPKLRTEMVKFLGPVLDSPGLISGLKWSPCALHVC